MRFLLASALFATAVVVSATVRADVPPAEPRTARLVYTPPGIASCPDEETMRNTVSMRLGYDPFKGDADRIITASIRRDGGALHAQIELRDPSFKVLGSRTLSSEQGDCVELGSAMALAISIAIDPMSITRPVPPPPGAAPAPAPAGSSAPPIGSASAGPGSRDAVAAPPSRRPVTARVRIGATGNVAFGSTPGVSFAPSLLLGLAYGRGSVDLEGRGHLPTSAEASPKGSVSASLLLASVVPCFHLHDAIGCAVLGVGRLTGTGRGVDLPESASATYVETGVRLGLEVPITGSFSARVAGDVLVPLVATTLSLRGADVWSSPPVVGSVGAGFLGQLP